MKTYLHVTLHGASGWLENFPGVRLERTRPAVTKGSGLAMVALGFCYPAMTILAVHPLTDGCASSVVEFSLN